MLLRSLAAADVVAGSQSFLQRTLEAAKVFEAARTAQAEEDREVFLRDREERDGRSATGRLPTAEALLNAPLNVLKYRDDRAAAERAQERHHKSPAYRELHRRYIGQTGMGGFGGEPGFEFSPRMHIDPDRPHMKTVYNNDRILSNMRYARFGHFVKELHMIDVDKLYRHARMVPPPPKLFWVMVQNRVPLTDRSCAALMRQQGRIMTDMASSATRAATLKETKELFEQLLLQNLPPADAGVQTHSEFIKCCAIGKDWAMGWDVLHARAVSMMTANPEDFMLTADYFEAVLRLCAACYKVKEGVQTLEQLLAINLRPTQATLDLAMDLLAQSVTISLDTDFDSESLAAEGIFGTAARTSVNGVAMDLVDDIGANGRRFAEVAAAAVLEGSTASLAADAAVSLDAETMAAVMGRADELWALYEYFDYTPTTESLKMYMKVLAGLGQGDRVLAALEYARGKELALDEELYIHAIAGLRHTKGSARLAVDLVARMASAGLAVSGSHHQLALMGAALQGDGEGALAYCEEHMVPHMLLRRTGLAGDVTFEMCLYALLAMAMGDARLATGAASASTAVAASAAPYATPAPPLAAKASPLPAHAASSAVRGLNAGTMAEAATNAANIRGLAVSIGASASSSAPRRMVETATKIMHFLDGTHYAFDVKGPIYEAYFRLCGWAGESVTEAHSMLKKVLAEGCELNPRMLNHVLLANANSPLTGSRLITEEVAQMLLVVPGLYATAETFVALDHCKAAHGGEVTEATEDAWDRLLGRSITIGQAALAEEDRVGYVPAAADGEEHSSSSTAASSSGAEEPEENSPEDTERLLASIPSDPPLAVPYVPAHAVRRQAVAVNLRAKDVHLKRHGQFLPIKNDHQRVAYGSMNGSTQMFGHRDSEAMR